MKRNEFNYSSEVIERDGYRFRVDLEYDPEHGKPWEDGDGNGIVIEPGRYYSKKPGHMLLYHGDRQDKWYFDWQGTVKKAREERWGMGTEGLVALAAKLGHTPTKGEVAVVGAQAEYDRFRAWLREDWWHCGVIVTLLTDDPDEDTSIDTHYRHALWGVEDGYYKPKYGTDYGEYKAEVIEELVSGYIKELNRERAERQYWAERDVVTLP